MSQVSATKLVPPSEEQLKKIFNEINLDKEQHKRDTKSLKEWLLHQPHLPHDIDEEMLASFIVGCKNSLERAKHILDTYLSNRMSCPDFYQDRDPCTEDFRRLNKLVQYFVLPGMTAEGYRVSIFGMKSDDVSPADFSLRMNAIKVLCSFDVRLLEENYWAGDIIIIDCKHFGFKHLQSVAVISVLKKYIHCANESLPKFVQRTITTTEDYPFLYDHVPRDILPEEYGGKAGNIEDLNDSWQLKIESHRDWFLKDMTRKVDESKRPEKSKYKPKDEYFGVEGSFKTLTID